MLRQPERLAAEPYEARSGDGVAELAADRKSEPAPGEAVRQAMHDYTRSPDGIARLEDRGEFVRMRETMAAAEGELARVVQGGTDHDWQLGEPGASATG